MRRILAAVGVIIVLGFGLALVLVNTGSHHTRSHVTPTTSR